MCSLENQQHSLCIKFCSKNRHDNDVTSYKRCVCKHSECSWSQKGQKCPEDIPDPTPGNPFSNNNYDLAALRSIMKEINIANHGHIHVKFNLWVINYDSVYENFRLVRIELKLVKPMMKPTSGGGPLRMSGPGQFRVVGSGIYVICKNIPKANLYKTQDLWINWNIWFKNICIAYMQHINNILTKNSLVWKIIFCIFWICCVKIKLSTELCEILIVQVNTYTF